jgi:hypothetical protein
MNIINVFIYLINEFVTRPHVRMSNLKMNIKIHFLYRFNDQMNKSEGTVEDQSEYCKSFLHTQLMTW